MTADAAAANKNGERAANAVHEIWVGAYEAWLHTREGISQQLRVTTSCGIVHQPDSQTTDTSNTRDLLSEVQGCTTTLT